MTKSTDTPTSDTKSKPRRGTRGLQVDEKPKKEKPQKIFILQDQPGFLLRLALQRHNSFFNNMMIDELTAPQFSTLAKLYELGTCSQNYLGRLISYDTATITGVIERLRTRNLIASRHDPLDRRRNTLELTAEGRRVAERAIARIAEVSLKTFDALTVDEKATLTRLLQKVAFAGDKSNDETP